MSSEPDKKSPKTLDDLVPIVADVIEHAQSIQETAEGAVGRVNAAAALVASTAKTLIAGQANLGADIEKGVGEKFNTALNGASARIGQQLALAEQQSKAALVCWRRPNFDHPRRLNLDQGAEAVAMTVICG
jgi:hypothetical protein